MVKEIKIIFDEMAKRQIMLECDNVFATPVCTSGLGDQLMEKICNNAIFIVANYNEEVAGYCAMYVNNLYLMQAYITMIAVKKQYQKRGIGQELLDTAIDLATRKQMKSLKLEVDIKNTKAIRFYEKNGFAHTEEKSKSGGIYMIRLLQV